MAQLCAGEVVRPGSASGSGSCSQKGGKCVGRRDCPRKMKGVGWEPGWCRTKYSV